MKDLLCLVLGGGRGTRLFPLTKDRCKPAVPFAGKYRLVDIPISNSLNSGFNQIYVLTQFNSESLNRHVARTYKLDAFTGGFVEIMAADQTMETTDWFQGTADAVRRSLKHFNQPWIKYVLVLSGDQLYKMDFRKLLSFHLENNSEITIACNPVEPNHIKHFGIMCADNKNRINNFVEKPQNEDLVKGMSIAKNNKRYYLASMGIYMFNKSTLTEILQKNNKADFGKEVIPDSFPNKTTNAYIHQGYWKDIGTIKAFYEENIALTDDEANVDFFDENWQVFTRPRYLPPAKLDGCVITRSIITEGTVLKNCKINHSVIGLRSVINDNSSIEDSIVMGADLYESQEEIKGSIKKGLPPIGINKNCIIRKAIVDKNARIGDGVKIINKNNTASAKSDNYIIEDGIVIIPKNAVIPAGAVI